MKKLFKLFVILIILSAGFISCVPLGPNGYGSQGYIDYEYRSNGYRDHGYRNNGYRAREYRGKGERHDRNRDGSRGSQEWSYNSHRE